MARRIAAGVMLLIVTVLVVQTTIDAPYSGLLLSMGCGFVSVNGVGRGLFAMVTTF